MANGTMTARSSDTFQIYLVDEDGQSTLGIDDGAKRQSLRVEIVNTSGRTISFKDMNENLSTNYHFCISFRPGTLINQGKDVTLVVQENQGQPIEIESNLPVQESAQEEVFFLRLKNGTATEILPSQRLTLVFGNIGAAPAGGARGTRVEIRLSNFQYVKSNQNNTKSYEDIPNQTRLQYLNIVNQRGKKQIPLYAGFFGSNTILNDGTENELTLSIQCLPSQNAPLRIEPYSSVSFDSLQDVKSDQKTSLGKTVIELLQEQAEFKDFIKEIANNAITQGMKGGIKLQNNTSNVLNSITTDFLNSITTDVTNGFQIFIEELIDDNWINDLLDGQKSIRELIESSQSIQNSFATIIFANSSIDQFICQFIDQNASISKKVSFLNSILPDEITNLNFFNKLANENNANKKKELANALISSVTSTGLIFKNDLEVILMKLGELNFTPDAEVLKSLSIIRLDEEVAKTGVLNFKGIDSGVKFDRETANAGLDEANNAVNKANVDLDESVTIRISFDVAPKKENSKNGSENWALVEQNNADDIQIAIAQGQDNWIFGGKFEQGITPQWSFVCKKPLEIKDREEILRLNITNLKTQLLSGYANLYVHYQNFPGYWDGFITVPIHKGPLAFRECEDTSKVRIGCVGIGTDEPKAKLHVNSSTGVVGLRVEGDAEITGNLSVGKLGIGTTDLGDNQLTVQGNTAFFGELKITIPDQNYYKSPESHFDRTGEGEARQNNETKPFVIAGTENDSAFLRLRSRVSYGNDNDQWELKAQKDDSGFSKLYISNPSSANPHKLVITNNGVGIGTTDLGDNQLKVQGNTAIAGNLSVSNGKVGIGSIILNKEPLVIRAQGIQEGLIAFEDPNGRKKWHIEQNTGGNQPGLNFVETNIKDFRLFIQQGGNIGIGVGDPKITLAIGDNDTGIKWNSDGNLSIMSNGQERIQITPRDVIIKGRISVEGEVWSKNYGNYWQKIRNQSSDKERYLWEGNEGQWLSSDLKLKKNIHPMFDAILQIDRLKPVSYFWQDTNYFLDKFEHRSLDPSTLNERELEAFNQDKEDLKSRLEKQQFGFIAQDLEQVFPNWVSINEDGYKQINLKMLPPLIVRAIQELKKNLDELVMENQILQKRLEKLERNS